MSRDRKRNRRDRHHRRNDHRDHKRDRNHDSLTAASTAFSDDPIISGGDSGYREREHGDDHDRYDSSPDDHRDDDVRSVGGVVYVDDGEHSLGGGDDHHEGDHNRDHFSLITAPDPLA